MPEKELLYCRGTLTLAATLSTRSPEELKPQRLVNVPAKVLPWGPCLPCMGPEQPWEPELHPTRPRPSRHRDIPGPPRGQTRLQVPSSPAAPCGGASGGGGRHLSCAVPGETSSRRARRTPSPRPLPPPACAVRGAQGRLRGAGGLAGSPGLSSSCALPALHNPSPASHQHPPDGKTWEGCLEGDALSSFCRHKSSGSEY